jgi:probable rRNA maturation factor
MPVEGLPTAMAGDLAISVETADRQAKEQGHVLVEELKVLILHGLLHLAGYDHETDDGRMARVERRLRGKLGLKAGLTERAQVEPEAKPVAAKKTAAKKRSAKAAPTRRRAR